MRKILIYPLTILLLLSGVMLQLANVFTLQAEGQQTFGPEITSPSAILMLLVVM